MADIIGTIMASILDYDHLTVITADPNVINPSVSKWVPADGRSIAGSALAAQTGRNFAPDLRGRFLRGVNTIYSIGEPALNILSANPETKLAGDYQEDRVGAHVHPIPTNDDGTPVIQGNYKTTAYSKRNGSTVYSLENENAQRETRVRNVSVYYYVKIN